MGAGAVVADGEGADDEGRRRDPGLDALKAPQLFGLAAGGVDAHDGAHSVALEVFLRVAGVDVALVVDDDGGGEAALADLLGPSHLSRAGLESGDRSVAGAGEDPRRA